MTNNGITWITKGGKHIPITNEYMNNKIRNKNKKKEKTEDDLSKKAFEQAEKINDELERAVQMQVADDLGKELDDDDIEFRAKNYIKNNYHGNASYEEIVKKLKRAYKNRGMYSNNKENNK